MSNGNNLQYGKSLFSSKKSPYDKIMSIFKSKKWDPTQKATGHENISKLGYRGSFEQKHGKGPTGLDYAKDYKYDPTFGEKILDKIPGLGGYRDFKRASDYGERVHGSPDELDRNVQAHSSSTTIKSGTTSSSTNVGGNKDLFRSSRLNFATDDPGRFTYSMSGQDTGKSDMSQYVSGTEAGHTAGGTSEQGYADRSIDKYNIATTKPGKTFMGIPYGFKGKITSNVAPGGGERIGSRLDPSYFEDQQRDVLEAGRMLR